MRCLLIRYRLLAEVGRRRTPDLPHEHLCVLSLPERVLCLVEHRRGSTCRSDPRRLLGCNGRCDRRCGNPGTKSEIRRIRPGLSCRVLYDQAFVFSLVLRYGLRSSCVEGATSLVHAPLFSAASLTILSYVQG